MRDILTVPLGWIAAAGWVVVLAGSLVYAVVGIAARKEATLGSELRAWPASQTSHGKGFLRSYETRFELGDGSSVTAVSRSGFAAGRACYLVRRVDGPGHFAWLRIVDGTSGPGPGQLSWPISQAECFSAADLSTLGH